MRFHVCVHRNPGQQFPKVWAGCRESRQVAFGVIGRNLALREVDKDVRLTQEAKRRKGYVDIGTIDLQDLGDLNTLSRFMKNMHESATDIRCEDRFLEILEGFALEMGLRYSLAHDPVKPQVVTDGFRGPVIEDISDSWF